MKTNISHIDISERKLLLRVVDIAVIVISLWTAEFLLDFDYIEFQKTSIYGWLFILAIYVLLFGEIFQLYDLDISNNRFKTVRSVVLTFLITTVVYIFTPFITPSLPENRLQIIYFFLVLGIPITVWRFLYIWMFFSPRYFKNIIVVGHSSRLKSLLQLIKDKSFHNISSYVSDTQIEGIPKFKDINQTDLYDLVISNNIKEVIVTTTGLSSNAIVKMNKELILLFEKGINIKSYENFYEEITDRIPKERLSYHFYKSINFSKNSTNKLYLFFSRLFDVLVSFLGLAIFLCIIPFVFVGNIVANRGPLLYAQERVGKNGKIFKIFKLRSMVTNAEENGAVWAKKNDTRITDFGKFLRLTRLDEIPQFYNILKGDMSLIGPRPERPEFVKDLEESIPFYAIRHVIKPGLTGWAQVNYPYANTVEEQEIKLRYDLFYIKQRDTFLDFKIIIKTITTVLFFKGQ